MDTSTAQILVFGIFVLAFFGFATFMDLRQKREGTVKTDAKPKTLL